ncbi:MAG: dTDP-4-dehydrorhamnose 3,5-epimerase [Elusimicrobiota bacterium]
MKIIPSKLNGVIVIEPRVFKDDRGFFFESYQQTKYQELGVEAPFVQDNHSRSSKGVLRGLHLQLNHTQGKLIRVLQGEIYDVVVDLRPGSPTFLQWDWYELSAENFRQVYVPLGFAHGFYSMSDVVEIEYKCTDYYDPKSEVSLLWNDPKLAIRWPNGNPILSSKDVGGFSLDEIISKTKHFSQYFKK